MNTCSKESGVWNLGLRVWVLDSLAFRFWGLGLNFQESWLISMVLLELASSYVHAFRFFGDVWELVKAGQGLYGLEGEHREDMKSSVAQTPHPPPPPRGYQIDSLPIP